MLFQTIFEMEGVLVKIYLRTKIKIESDAWL